MSARLRGIRAAHGSTDVLHDIDLLVGSGERVSVLGPSGSGKSTLLRVVAGLHRPRAGSVEIHGRDVTDAPPERRRVGFVPQEGALFPHLDVAGNVGYGIRGLRASAARRDPRVQELVELVGLRGLQRRRPHELSGGQRQRVAVARALATAPDLVLLDEPFSALDAALRRRLRDDVVEILRGRGVGALLITHDQEEALSLGDRVIVLRDGRIVQDDSARAVYACPADAWTARFVGEALVLPATARGDVASCALGDLPLARAARGRIAVVVRPEQVRVTAAGGVPGVVERMRYFGHDALVDVVLGDGTRLSARLAAGRDLPAGGPVRVSVTSPVAPVAADG